MGDLFRFAFTADTFLLITRFQSSVLHGVINVLCGFSPLQDPLTEHAAYEQMALFASACAFSWSKWNAKCGAEHLVMQVFSLTHRYSLFNLAFYPGMTCPHPHRGDCTQSCVSSCTHGVPHHMQSFIPTTSVLAL